METSCSKEVRKQDFVGSSHEAELELGLGLSLGGRGGGGGGSGVKILTAQDFPSIVSHGSATSSRFSASTGRTLGSISGTKRTADSVSQDVNGSAPAVSQVVGWPPIRTYRMNNLASHTKSVNAEQGKMLGENRSENDSTKKEIHSGNDKSSPAKDVSHPGFVKLNMDGVQIGRKIDLSAYSCYETLAQTIEDMFFRPSTAVNLIRGEKEAPVKLSKLLNGSSEFALTYEDKEGDWMLVGDVPWGMFLSTVKRLRIMRTSEANGLAPRFQERNRRQRSKPI
ncbi:hypothetical protein Ancab_030733 [Ancistrocladus abbreviatus]